MECFIKKVFTGKIDEDSHRQFVRFGKGIYPGRAALNLKRGENIKLGGGFEYANDFVELVSELGDCKFSGIILSREELSGLNGKKKAMVWQHDVKGINSAKIKEIRDKAYTMLLDAEGSGIVLKMKKKLPKPGKSADSKADDKFCILEADLRYWPAIRDAFMLPECKKAKVSHTVMVDEIIINKNEKDFVKMRESAKRKGKIVRKAEIDGQENLTEKNVEV
jgi:hypothetical protein